MSKLEDIVYLSACIQSSNDVYKIEQMFVEMTELLAKGTKYKTDINEALGHYYKLREKINEGKLIR